MERYGIEEVSQWYFEVWNEPNLDFWAGRSEGANLLSTLRLDGASLEGSQIPGSGSAGRQPRKPPGSIALFATSSENNVPVDFVSTHVYANDLSDRCIRHE